MPITERCSVCGSSVLLEICRCNICGFEGTHSQIMNEHGHTQSSNIELEGKNYSITTQKKCLECNTIGEY